MIKWYNLIRDIMSIEEFKAEIEERRRLYDDLFDRETIALLIIDELGRNTLHIKKIKDLQPGINCTLFGIVLTYNDKTIEMLDETGIVTVVADEKIKGVKPMDTIKIINGYVDRNLEIRLDRYSLIEVLPIEILPSIDIKGVIEDINPTHVFLKDNDEYGFVTTTTIKSSNDKHTIFIWNEHIKKLQSYKTGDPIYIKNVSRRKQSNGIELHVNSSSTIL
ncbi:MAG TPA: hypothetical protein ENI44_03380 [Thermoplasmatales archaeon]|nr:hypothetical protein [Thermoplasmatales archaeon]